MKERSPGIIILIVTYGKRWQFLSQVIEVTMKEAHVKQLVIVDNGSKNKEEIEKGVKIYGEKVVVVRHEKNLGSAGGFASGLRFVQRIDCDFVLILDDDNVPEEGTISKFLELRKEIHKENIVLVGNRVNIPGNESVFYSGIVSDGVPKGTFFEGINWSKIKHFFNLMARREIKEISQRIKPALYVRNESFVYSGAFIPIDAIRKAPLPDSDLVLYGDDIEYSWGIKKLGYDSYVCFSPKIYDLEMSFGEESQAVGLFDPQTPHFKLYYRIRNMVRISVRNTRQNQIILFINVLIWIVGLSIVGLIRYGLRISFFKKVRLLVLAVYGGYVYSAKIPTGVVLP